MKDASTLTNFEDVVLVMSRSAASTTCYNIGIYTLFRVEDGVLRNPVPPADRDTILAWLHQHGYSRAVIFSSDDGTSGLWTCKENAQC